MRIKKEQKDDNIVKAYQHISSMNSLYEKEINEQIINTKIYDNNVFNNKELNKFKTSLIVEALDSVSAIYKYANTSKICVLNFASYKEPGGLFLFGSLAQEESLCHNSTLYNVIKDDKFKSYYEYNSEHLNSGFYTNRALYTKDVIFNKDNNIIKCDVLTCAAPNFYAGRRYHSLDKTENSKYLKERIKFILDIANENKVEVLILGAFGCGVFCQDPVEVSTLFKDFINNEYKGAFKTVVFAIPSGKNLTIFKEIIK